MIKYSQRVMDEATVTEKARIEADIFGIVQGVTFRGTTIQVAQKLGLTGWVMNMRDGSVRIVAEGKKSDLEDLIRFLHEGPRAARVARVEVEWLEATGKFDQFTVRF